MDTLTLTDQLSFSIESDNDRLRLVVFKEGQEWVCHKTTVKELNHFTANETAHLFKGRLQLAKAGDLVLVNVKGNDIGTVSLAKFSQLLASAVS